MTYYKQHLDIVMVECISYSHQRAQMFAATQRAYEIGHLPEAKPKIRRATTKKKPTQTAVAKKSRAGTPPRRQRNRPQSIAS